MKDLLKRFWFPAIVVCVIAFHAVGMGVGPSEGDPGYGFISATRSPKPDTIKYKNQFIKSGQDRSLTDTASWLTPIDTTPQLTARDTIFPPDSLKDIDPFRYKYYVALIDSLTHKIVSDSLKQAGDSLDWPVLDSLYELEAAARKKAAYDEWYNSLSKDEKKKLEIEKKERLLRQKADSIQEIGRAHV